MPSVLRLRRELLVVPIVSLSVSHAIAACTTEVSIGVQPPSMLTPGVGGDDDADVGTGDGSVDAADTSPEVDVPDAPPAPIECGGETGETCPDGAYCAFDTAVCGSSTGTCRTKPPACTGEIDPVCGCDSLTYDNECEAARVGQSIAHEGACPMKKCGGGAPPCAADEFCAYELEHACGSGGSTAYCSPRPETCPKIIDHVCGCDGITYDNECDANRHGIPIRAKGACT